MRNFPLRLVAGAALSVLAMSGCAPPSSSATLTPGRSLDNDSFVRSSRSGVGRNEQAITSGSGPQGQQVLFINFDGATITRTADDVGDDSAKNESWIPDTFTGSKAFPAFDVTPYKGYTKATAEAFILNQVQTWYADFNVYVVTTRPTSGEYTMLMVGDTTTDFYSAGGNGVVGIATLDCGNQEQNNIGFDFAESIIAGESTADQTDLLLVAQTVAHEAGHTFGLQHDTNMNDIMYPSVSPTVQGFVDSAYAFTDGSSSCGSQTTQNSHAVLLANLGPAPAGGSMGTTTPNPIVTILAPKSGDTVGESFTVAVSAQEPTNATGTITKVELYQDTTLIDSVATPPYQFPETAPGTGSFTLTAKAYNSEGGTTSVDTTFNVTANGTQGPIGCIVSADCTAPQVCNSGTCGAATTLPDAGLMTGNPTTDGGVSSTPDGANASFPPGSTGAACTDSSECGDGVCATKNGQSFCTNVCDPGNASACPVTFECALVSGAHYCVPKSSGGCSFVGWRATPSSGSWLFVAAALLLVSRRRRSRPSAT